MGREGAQNAQRTATYLYLYVYICYTPLLNLGVLNSFFGVENLGLEMCMDES